jgi:hypothetical protein
MLRAGMRLGERYRLEERLGAGGMGEVWRAVDELLGRPVAVKAMLPSVARDPDFARRFVAEAKAMARVNHPAVASIHDYGQAGGLAYLVMELVDGESLAQRLGRAGRLGAGETMRIVAQAADGLQAIHDQGIVHRDIKPANLLVRRDGSVVITDFGIARHADAGQLTASGAILGTPSYLSPEQVMGQPATPLSDVYSLGLTAYECLAGERPFVGDNPYAVALQRLQSAPRTIGITLPAEVLLVVERALAIDPGQRWPTAAALAEAARGRAPVATVARPAGSNRKVLIAAALAVLLIAIAGGAWFLGRDRDKPTSQAGGGATAAAPATGKAPDGFSACADAFCPVEPMCWGGLTSISGDARPPEQVACAGEHYWETFAAFTFPAAAADGRADELMERPDVSGLCTAGLMGSRSKNAKATTSWRREAWPIRVKGGVTLLHCLAGPENAEAHAGAFRAAGQR